MSSDRFTKVLRAVALLLPALVIALWSSDAAAAGQIKWKNKTLEERNKTSWTVECEIHMPKPPDVAHMPMKFEFEPTVYYARDLVEGDKIVERKEPLVNKMPLIESVDVGFLDPGTGKVERRTRFSFKVTRSQGYEAGEYKVTVRDGRSGKTIGTPTTLVFKGENETVDRRPMVFTGNDKKKSGEGKKDGAPADAAANTQKIDLNDEDDGAAAAEGSADKGSDSSSRSESGSMNSDDAALADDDEPQTIKEKPGGCGCRTAGTAPASPLALLAVLGVVLVARARRRH